MKKNTIVLIVIHKHRHVKVNHNGELTKAHVRVTGSGKEVFLISIPILSRSPQIYYRQLGMPSSILQKMRRLMGKWKKYPCSEMAQ